MSATRSENNKMGLLDTARPILGYVLAIALILLLATHQVAVEKLHLSSFGFMSTVSVALVSSSTTMAQILIESQRKTLRFETNRGAIGWCRSCFKGQQRRIECVFADFKHILVRPETAFSAMPTF